MSRFTLYGSPHSLPTYKVALMLRLSGEPFSFRYVSFQKGMHKTPEFLTLSRWAQVPVLLDNGRTYLQATAIIEHLAETLGRFEGRVEPAIADHHSRRAEMALATFDAHLAHRGYLCAQEPTIADLVCCADLALATMSGIDLDRWKNVSDWAARVKALPRFAAPFDLLSMADAEFA